jgi:hypothetical protein
MIVDLLRNRTPRLRVRLVIPGSLAAELLAPRNDGVVCCARIIPTRRCCGNQMIADRSTIAAATGSAARWAASAAR